MTSVIKQRVADYWDMVLAHGYDPALVGLTDAQKLEHYRTLLLSRLPDSYSADDNSLSLRMLIELVRTIDPRLAREVTSLLDEGVVPLHPPTRKRPR